MYWELFLFFMFLLGFMSNLVLLIGIMRTSNRFGTYKFLNLIFTLLNVIHSAVHAFTAPSYINLSGFLVIYSEANLVPTAILEIFLCIDSALILFTMAIPPIHLFHLYCLLIKYENRFRPRILSVLLIPLFFAILWALVLFTLFGENPEVSKMITEKMSVLEIEDSSNVAYFAIGWKEKDIMRIIGVFYGLSLAISTIAITIYFWFKISCVRIFIKTETDIETEFFVTLLCQLLIPLTLLYTPFLLCVFTFFNRDTIFAELSIFSVLMSVYLLLDSIAIILTIRSYRVKFKELVRKMCRQMCLVKRRLSGRVANEPQIFVTYSQGQDNILFHTGTNNVIRL